MKLKHTIMAAVMMLTAASADDLHIGGSEVQWIAHNASYDNAIIIDYANVNIIDGAILNISGIMDMTEGSTLNVEHGSQLLSETLAMSDSHIYVVASKLNIETLHLSKNSQFHAYDSSGADSTVSIGNVYFDGEVDFAVHGSYLTLGSMAMSSPTSGTVFFGGDLTLELYGTVTAGSISADDGFSMVVTDKTMMAWLQLAGENDSLSVFTFNTADYNSEQVLSRALQQALATYNHSGNYQLAWTDEGGNRTLTVSGLSGNSPIPEPSTATLGLVGLSALLLRRRRKVA